MELPELIPFLRANGVLRFKNKDLEIELKPIEIPSQVVDMPEPANMPAGLKATDLMDEQSILNWSAPPGPETQHEPPMPLTGDAPIEPPAALG